MCETRKKRFAMNDISVTIQLKDHFISVPIIWNKQISIWIF